MPVLITGGLSPEAYRLQRILKMQDVVFADETELPLFSNTKSVVLPAYTSSSFVHEMLKTCLDQDINRVYPLKWGEIIELSKARELFSEYGVILMIPSENWLKNKNGLNLIKGENLTVIEQGKTLAGSVVTDNDLLYNETGVYTWATMGQKTEYSIYVI